MQDTSLIFQVWQRMKAVFLPYPEGFSLRQKLAFTLFFKLFMVIGLLCVFKIHKKRVQTSDMAYKLLHTLPERPTLRTPPKEALHG